MLARMHACMHACIYIYESPSDSQNADVASTCLLILLNLLTINSVNPGSKLNFSSFLFYTSISKQLREEEGGAELEKTES